MNGTRVIFTAGWRIDSNMINIYRPIKAKAKRKTKTGGKVLAKGWWALLSPKGDVVSVHFDNCYQCAAKYLKRVNIVEARAK